MARQGIVGYIVNLLTNSRVEFELMPDELSDSNSAQFEDVSPLGRSGPLRAYSSSGPRAISFTLQLHNDYCKDGILNTVNKLKALTYPAYTGGNIMPPKCLVRIGDMINCTATCDEVGVNWMKPIVDNMYVMAEVSISLSEVTSKAKSTFDVEKGELNGAKGRGVTPW